MAGTTQTTYIDQTGILVIDAMTTGYKWVPDSSRTIKYSVSGGFNGEQWVDAQTVSRYIGAAEQVHQL